MYLHHRYSKIFFHPAKFDNFKDEKILNFKTVSLSQRKNLLVKKVTCMIDYSGFRLMDITFILIHWRLQKLKNSSDTVFHAAGWSSNLQEDD